MLVIGEPLQRNYSRLVVIMSQKVSNLGTHYSGGERKLFFYEPPRRGSAVGGFPDRGDCRCLGRQGRPERL